MRKTPWAKAISAAALALGCLAYSPSSVTACGTQAPCSVENGTYLVRTPKHWNGKSPLPVLFFFHGYRGSALQTMEHHGYRKVAEDNGALLVALEGLKGTWSFPGKVVHTRDDFRYVAAVRADILRRFTVDMNAMLVAGHSLGGSMAWYVACIMGRQFSAYAPVAGAYWRPHPVACNGGPVNMRHVHGLNDQTVPMQGRSLRGGTIRQGNVRQALASLLATNQCPPSPSASMTMGRLSCSIWPGRTCASGREAVLCLHAGGHEIEAAWLADAFYRMSSLPHRQAGR